VKLIKIIGDRHLFELLRGSMVAFLFKLTGVAIGYLFFYVLADYYGTEGVGVFSTLWTILLFCIIFAKLGFDTSIVKYIAGFYGQKKFSFIKIIYRKGVFIILLAGTIITLLVFAFSNQISLLFFENSDYSFFIFLVGLLTIPMAIINYNAESLKSLKNITGFSILQNGTIYIVMLMFLFILNHYSFSADNIIYSLCLTFAVLIPLSFLMISNSFSRRLKRQDVHSETFSLKNKDILQTTFPMFLSSFLFFILSWTDILMLSYYLPESDVGVYSMASKIAAVNTLVLVAVNSIAMPKFAEIFERNDKSLFRNFIKQSTLLVFIFSFPVLILIMLFPSEILQVFGTEFAEGKNTLLILAAGQFFSAFSGSTINILNMCGREKAAQYILIFSSIPNILLNYFLIPVYGIEGAAIATSATLILWNLLAVLVIYRKFGFLTFPFNVKFKK